MATFELKMPKLGESITEATITRWLKNVGDRIELDDPILELATDKVDSEIPSPVEGVLKEQLFKEGDTVEVDTVIAIIEMEGEADVEDRKEGQTAEAAPEKEPEKPAEHTSETAKTAKEDDAVTGITSPEGFGESERFYSPLVRSIAREENIPLAELEKIPGSGKNNRLTKDDLLKYLKTRSEKPAAAEEPVAEKSEKTSVSAAKPTPPAIPVGEKDEVVAMDRMRKLIAEHMVMSEDTSVHITLFREVDMENIVRWRNKYKKVLMDKEGEKLTFTPIFIEAIAKALRDYPMVNVSIDGQNIIKRKNINVGMAAALPDGNLIVPVIKNADHKSLLGLAKEVNDLAQRARQNKLKPDDIQGGTFTLTNFGTFGATMGTPIINQPQVGILGVGLIQKKPVVIEGPHGDSIGIRHRMDLSLSCDHRIVDGALGGMFLQRVAEYLENFDTNQGI
ncbi:MAG: 2-oxo acid dehydrogenase subunit E2 [Bacteroidia bacterium]|nr:MAG: 2-oxo acid dehydrogenase subunit E2 [Bacteroidia bacterium]